MQGFQCHLCDSGWISCDICMNKSNTCLWMHYLKSQKYDLVSDRFCIRTQAQNQSNKSDHSWLWIFFGLISLWMKFNKCTCSMLSIIWMLSLESYSSLSSCVLKVIKYSSIDWSRYSIARYLLVLWVPWVKYFGNLLKLPSALFRKNKHSLRSY